MTGDLESPPEDTIKVVTDKVLNYDSDVDGINAFLEKAKKAKSMSKKKNKKKLSS